MVLPLPLATLRRCGFALCALIGLLSLTPPGFAQGGAGARSAGRAELLDRVVAIVNDEAITYYEVNAQRAIALDQLRAQKIPPPAPDVLEKQVLERLINERVMLQVAKNSGLKVDDVQVERTMERIAQENNLTMQGLRDAVAKEGIPFARYREDLRRELLVQRLRERIVESQVQVSDTEVDNFLATLSAQGGDSEYRLAHVLVLVPDQGTPEQIEARRRRAEEALQQIRRGTDFAQVAASYSDAPDALQGGNLGWRSAARLPTVFAGPVRALKPGEVSPLLRSPSGFHIVKLLETRNRNAPTIVDQTHTRHILIKVNEITSESEARARVERIKDRIDAGGKFEDQARINSEDPSAANGGDLGWISPGDTVPDFEKVMQTLKPGEVSQPVRTPFGWHLIQVIERRSQDVTQQKQRDQARMALRQRKGEESFQDWVRQMRDRAYIEVKSDEG